ncbi:MAG: hypothetical protein R6U27_15650 [Desulfobacterales bacterium]
MVEDQLIGFQCRVLKSLTQKGAGQTTIIVRRRFESLANEVRIIFSGQPDVNVIVDRRYCRDFKKNASEAIASPVHGERRQLKERLIDVVISIEADND